MRYQRAQMESEDLFFFICLKKSNKQTYNVECVELWE